MNFPKRKQIRLSHYDYSSPGYYYITICTKDRKSLFGEITGNFSGKISEATKLMRLNKYGDIIDKIWTSLEERFSIELDIYQIMPNHIHGIIVIKSVGAASCRPITLGIIIGYFKYQSAKQLNNSSGAMTAPLQNKEIFPKIWQRNYYEHVIRNDIELNEIRQYILDNPINWEKDEENPKKFLNSHSFQVSSKITS